MKQLIRICRSYFDAPHKAYIVVASLGVIGFALITPPFQGPDEEAHYIRAQYLVHGYILPVDAKRDENAKLPNSIFSILEKTFYNDDLRGDTNDKYELFRSKEALKVEFSSTSSYKPIMVPYSPIPYIPAVPGLAISNMLNLSPLMSLYIARLSIGAAAVCIMYSAIKLMPRKKYLLAIVALFPMMIFQQAMVSADGVSFALLALLVAYVLRLYSEKTTALSSKQGFLLLGLVVLVALSKTLIYVFIPVVLILWRKPEAKKWIIVAALLAITCVGIWSMLTSNLITSPVGGQVDSGRQISELASHPLRVLRVAWNTYMSGYSDSVSRSIVGTFGYSDTVMPLWLVFVSVALFALGWFVSLDNRALPIPHWFKWVMLLVSIIYFAAVNAAMYLTYSPVGFSIIYGVQGRYFLPIAIVLGVILSGHGIRTVLADRSKLRAYVIVGSAFVLLLALIIVLQRYYLYTP